MIVSRNYSVLAVSVSEKQTDAAHVTEMAQAVADRMERCSPATGVREILTRRKIIRNRYIILINKYAIIFHIKMAVTCIQTMI